MSPLVDPGLTLEALARLLDGARDEAGVAQVARQDAVRLLGATVGGVALAGRPHPVEAPELLDLVDRTPVFAAGDQVGLDAGATVVRLPLAVEPQVFGALWMVFDRRLEQHDHLLLRSFALLVARALQRRHLAASDHRSRERLRFLAEASEVLSSSLDYRLTLANVAVLAVPRLADGFSVDILTADQRPQREITTHLVAEKAGVARRLAAEFPPHADAPLGIGSVLRAGSSSLVAEVREDHLRAMARGDEHLALLRSLGLRSQMVVPMRRRNQLLGALTFVVTEGDRRFTADDLALAEDLARRAALAVENARLHEQVRRSADESVSSLLVADRERLRLATLLRQLPVGVVIAEPPGRIVLGNDAMQRMLRRPFRTGTPLQDWGRYAGAHVDGTPVGSSEWPLARALAGETVGPELGDVERADGTTAHIEIRSAPIRDTTGEVVAAVATFDDVTDRAEAEAERARLLVAEQEARARAEQAQRRLTFLLEASTLLSTSLAYPAAYQRIARLAVPTLGDLCIVDITSSSGAIERVAALHSDPAMQPLADELARRYPPEPDGRHPVVEVIRTGRSVWADDLSDAFLHRTTRNSEHLQLARRIGFRAFMCVPLLAQGRPIGTLTLVSTRPGRHISAEDVALAEDFALRAGLALDNARLYSREHELAGTLQKSLLLETLPDVPGLEMDARYVAGGAGVQVGGDWYDVIPLRGGQVVLVVGDVVGRGLRAASVMGQLRNAVHAYALDGRTPGQITGRLSRLLDEMEPGQMATLVVALFEPATGRLVYSSAGHPPPLILRHGSPALWLEDGRYVPLGVLNTGDYPEAVATLERGDTLLLYTDGLVEDRSHPIDEGFRRLVEVSRNAGDVPVSKLSAVILEEIIGPQGGHDDTAVLVVRNTSRSGGVHATLAATTASLAAARNLLRPWLEEAGASDDQVFDILVACGEACANAIEHAYGPGDHEFDLTAHLDQGDVVVVVSDTGQWRAPRGRDRGRGRGIMEALMDEATFDTGSQGTKVQLRRHISQRKDPERH